ncbi:MAG: hypothetical protein ACJ76J_27815 [Thermoanaerobaculia bacterium]
MTTPFRNFLLILICLPALMLGLVGVNYLVIKQLLHLDRSLSPVEQSGFIPMAKPLVLAMSTDMKPLVGELFRRMGVRVGIEQIPREHPLLIHLSWIQRANPYPPVLAEISESYQSSYFSFGYLGVDRRYHQVTLYGGELDTLPTFLVKKVRGRSTLWGDYYAQYLVHLSRETEPLDPNGRPYYPQIDSIEWASFRGGSYNGFEEIFGNAAATLAELLLIGVVSSVVLSRRRRRSLLPV